MILFSKFLDLLKVKHTKWFATKYFEEHPNKYNLLGISSILNDYNIPNVAFKVKDKNIDLLNVPFIAHSGDNNFNIVRGYDQKNVYIDFKAKKIKVPLLDFINNWTGIVLIAEPNKNSI